MAFDGGSPAKSASALLIVNILRNQFPPRFVNEPYSRTIDRNEGTSTNIITVTATDDDNQVPAYYQLLYSEVF